MSAINADFAFAPPASAVTRGNTAAAVSNAASAPLARWSRSAERDPPGKLRVDASRSGRVGSRRSPLGAPRASWESAPSSLRASVCFLARGTRSVGWGTRLGGAKASPLCPVKTVTHVRGCTECMAASVCMGVRKSVRSTPWRLDFEPLVRIKAHDRRIGSGSMFFNGPVRNDL